jgi:putative transposase
MIPLEPGNYYHIYNRGNNKEDIFLEDRNYEHFLNLYQKHVTPAVETFAYCLLKNHFHLLIRVKEPDETCEVLETSQVPRRVSYQFSNLFNAYAKAFNKAYGRTGSLFQERFRRKVITSESHLYQTIRYIHVNPQRHGFIRDFREYPFSSYVVLVSDRETFLGRGSVLQWFGDREAFKAFHQDAFDEEILREIILEDED